MKKSQLRQIIREELQSLNERKDYPSQHDAEAMLTWLEASETVWFGGASSEIRSAFNKADDIRLKLHAKIFGDDSPWSIERRGKKAKVVWDKHKAERLGL